MPRGSLSCKRQGFDITEGHRRGGIEIVATREQVSKLRGKGLKAKLVRDRRGRTAKRAAAAQAAGGWQVWRPYARTDVELSDAAGNPTDNFVTQLRKLANRYDKITELVPIGRTLNGLPLLRDAGDEERLKNTRRAPPGGSLLGHAARARVACR